MTLFGLNIRRIGIIGISIKYVIQSLIPFLLFFVSVIINQYKEEHDQKITKIVKLIIQFDMTFPLDKIKMG